MARGAVVAVTSPHADFHGSPRLALDDSLNRYVLQGRIVERDILNDSGYASSGSIRLGRGIRQAEMNLAEERAFPKSHVPVLDVP